MKKYLKTTLITKALLIIALVAVPAGLACGFHGGFNHGGMKGHFGHGLKMFDELELTDVQKKEIAGIVSEYRDELQPMVDTAFEKHDVIKDLVHQQNFDELTLRQAHQDLSKQKEDILVTFAKMIHEIRPVLTPEQITKIEDFHTLHPGPGNLIKAHVDHVRNFIDNLIETWSN